MKELLSVYMCGNERLPKHPFITPGRLKPRTAAPAQPWLIRTAATTKGEAWS